MQVMQYRWQPTLTQTPVVTEITPGVARTPPVCTILHDAPPQTSKLEEGGRAPLQNMCRVIVAALLMPLTLGYCRQ